MVIEIIIRRPVTLPAKDIPYANSQTIQGSLTCQIGPDKRIRIDIIHHRFIRLGKAGFMI